MTNNEIRAFLSKKNTEQFELDPRVKNEITRSILESVIRDVKKTLAAKKSVTIVIGKE